MFNYNSIVNNILETQRYQARPYIFQVYKNGTRAEHQRVPDCWRYPSYTMSSIQGGTDRSKLHGSTHIPVSPQHSTADTVTESMCSTQHTVAGCRPGVKYSWLMFAFACETHTGQDERKPHRQACSPQLRNSYHNHGSAFHTHHAAQWWVDVQWNYYRQFIFRVA